MPPKLTVRPSGSAPSRSRAARHTAVERRFRPGHVAGGVRGEEENPVRDILHLPSPTGLPPEKTRHPTEPRTPSKSRLSALECDSHTHGRGRLFRGGTGKALSEPFTNIHVVFQNDSDPDLETS